MKPLIGFIFLSFLFTSYAKEADEIKYFPINGIFIPSAKDGKNLIHPDFVKNFNRKNASEFFVTEFRKMFPNAVDKIEPKDKYKTLIASVQVLRASRYEVSKGEDQVDIYLPLTLSLYFINPNSSEIVFKESFTHYQIYSGFKNKIDNAVIKDLIDQGFNTLLTKILTDVKSKLLLIKISTNVKKEWNGFYVFDKGKNDGIVKDDFLSDKYSNQAQIIYSSESYSIALPFLGKINSQNEFFKFVSGDIDKIKKQKVLIFDSAEETILPKDLIGQYFGDSLKDKAGFSVISVNSNFSQIQKTYIEEAGIEQKKSIEREPPDYFIRFSLLKPNVHKSPSRSEQIEFNFFSVVGFAELLDGSGRVIYSKTIKEEIQDEVVQGKTFSEQDRLEILIKNIISSLAQDFSEKIKFNEFQNKVISVEDKDFLTVEDNNNVLKQGFSYRIFTNIGEDIYVPIWEGSILEKYKDGSSKVNLILPLSKKSPKPSKGDVIIVNSVGEQEDLSNTFTICPKAENLGGRDYPEISKVTYYKFSELVHPFFSDSSNEKNLRIKVGPASGFKKIKNLKFKEANNCLSPVYKLTIQKGKCENKICNDKINLTFGVRVKKAGAEIAQAARENEINIPVIREFEDSIYNHEIYKYFFEFIEDINKELVEQKIFYN